MWNHEADVDALMDDFCRSFFGPAAAQPDLEPVDLRRVSEAEMKRA